jgi:hypothetical protein
VGVFDPATARFYLRNSNSAGGPSVAAFAFGAPGWKPIVGDWDGNGTATAGVVNPATETWYLKNSNTPGGPDIPPFAFGAPGWVPVVGDWDGNGTTTAGVVDPAKGSWYLKNSNSGGAPSVAPFSYGAGSWKPVAGDWDFPSALLADRGDRSGSAGAPTGPAAAPLAFDPLGVAVPTASAPEILPAGIRSALTVASAAVAGVPVNGSQSGQGETVGIAPALSSAPEALWGLAAPGMPPAAGPSEPAFRSHEEGPSPAELDSLFAYDPFFCRGPQGPVG